MATYQIGVLAMYLQGKRLEELSFFRKLCVNGQRLGLEVLVFTPDDVQNSTDRIHALTYDSSKGKWVRKWASFPSIIYDRARYHGATNYRKIKAFRERYPKLRYISRPLANKWTMHKILSEDEKIAPHLPETVKYQDAKELARFLKKHAIVYMKPHSGTGGRGILRLQRLEGGDTFLMQGRDPNRRIIPPQRVTPALIPGRLSTWKLDNRYILQQGIPLQLKDGRVHDFRMLLQKDGGGQWQVTGCAGRVGPKRSVTSNLHGGGQAIPMETLLQRRFSSVQKVEQIKRSAYALGLRIAEHLEQKFGRICEAGIDLAVDPKGHVWLLEVNPKPSREVFYRIGEKDTYRKAVTRPLEYALWALKQKKNSASSGSGSSSEEKDS
jgi:hypothetical protein